MKLTNKIHFEFDGFTFEADLPFKPEEGEYIIISGKNAAGENKEVVTKISSLIYNTIKGYWIMNKSLQEWHKKQGELKETNKDLLGLEL